SFDGRGVVSWDSSLVTFVRDITGRLRDQGVTVDPTGLPDGVQRLLALASTRPERVEVPAAPAHRSWLVWLGGAVLMEGRHLHSELSLLGEVTASLGRFCIGRARVRAIDILAEVKEAGIRALPIVTLTSFLLGMIMAFVGAAALRPFGAGIYVANV